MKTRIEYVRETRGDGSVSEWYYPQYKWGFFWVCFDEDVDDEGDFRIDGWVVRYHSQGQAECYILNKLSAERAAKKLKQDRKIVKSRSSIIKFP